MAVEYNRAWVRPLRHMNPVQPLFLSSSSFVRYIDYLVVTTLHSLMVKSVTKLLAMLQEQGHQTPSRAVIESWSNNSEAVTDPDNQDMDKKVGLGCYPVFPPAKPLGLLLFHAITLRRCSRMFTFVLSNYSLQMPSLCSPLR